MSLLVLGVSHRTAPLAVLERAIVAESDQPKFLARLLDHAAEATISEAVVISTCNRVEVWAVVEAFHAGVARIGEELVRQTGISVRELTEHCYVHYGKAAVGHVFSVAGSLESMVVGEPQILGQVRTAYATATAAGTVGAGLHSLVQHALRVGKAVQSQTAVAKAGPSMVSRALDQVSAGLADDGVVSQSPTGWSNLRVAVVGAGAIGSLVVADLKNRAPDVAKLLVFSRSMESARRLAATAEGGALPAEPVEMARLVELLPDLDVLVTCAGATGTLLVAEDFAEANRLTVCDLSVPRDVDPAAGELPGVRLVDTQSILDGDGEEVDQEALAAAEALVAGEVAAYLQDQLRQSVVPTVTALRQRAEEVVADELLRLDGKLPGLDSAYRSEVAKTVRRVVDKLLHTPTTRVKELAGDGDGGKYAEALRELFGLTPGAVGALTGTAQAEGAPEPSH